MTTQKNEVEVLRDDFRSHEIWDKAEHTALRKEHETDYRSLVTAINDVKIAVQSGFNKVLMFLGGGILAGATTIVATVILNHK